MSSVVDYLKQAVPLKKYKDVLIEAGTQYQELPQDLTTRLASFSHNLEAVDNLEGLLALVRQDVNDILANVNAVSSSPALSHYENMHLNSDSEKLIRFYYDRYIIGLFHDELLVYLRKRLVEEEEVSIEGVVHAVRLANYLNSCLVTVCKDVLESRISLYYDTVLKDLIFNVFRGLLNHAINSEEFRGQIEDSKAPLLNQVLDELLKSVFMTVSNSTIAAPCGLTSFQTLINCRKAVYSTLRKIVAKVLDRYDAETVSRNGSVYPIFSIISTIALDCVLDSWNISPHQHKRLRSGFCEELAKTSYLNEKWMKEAVQGLNALFV
ncbi:hypothetical protein RCL1_008994 [Eukaryota sp. TZLM3-RCL]